MLPKGRNGKGRDEGVSESVASERREGEREERKQIRGRKDEGKVQDSRAVTSSPTVGSAPSSEMSAMRKCVQLRKEVRVSGRSGCWSLGGVRVLGVPEKLRVLESRRSEGVGSP